MLLSNKNIIFYLTISYFAVAGLEIFSEYLQNKDLIFSLKPLITLILILLYCIESVQRNLLFISALVFSLITNILFIPNTADFLFCALTAFTVHRILIVFVVLKLQKIQDYIPVFIATVPFILVFFYLFMETAEIPENNYYLLIIQNILISVLSGLALACYVMNDNKQNSILLISILLFVMLQFIVFVEKYLLINEYASIFRPIAMTFNVLAFYSLYKYVIVAEKSNHN